jgi:hypothetical protein
VLEKDKVSLCKIIKEIYKNEVLPFNNKLTGLKAYNEAYMKIAGLLDGFNATTSEICMYIGDEFFEWYSSGYDKVVAEFLDNEGM